MEHRLTERTSAPFFLVGPTALLLAALLMVSGGPGTAAAAARPQAQEQTRAAAAELQADPIGDLALELEYDADRIFRFVADEIRYEPYPGILRGALGTLQARAGNSVDKALLLAALFDKSLVVYRFARGSLDEATTAVLLGTITTDTAGARRIAKDPLERGLEQVTSGDPSARPVASGPLVDEPARSVEAEGMKRLELAEARLGDTVTLIEEALQGAGIDLPSGGVVSLPSAETAGHTWVQMMNGPAWVDLDPTLPGSQPGAVLTHPGETLPELPDDIRYPVEFEVLVERLSGGQLTANEVLTYVGFADQLAETPVTFGHVTPSGLKSLGFTLSNLLGDGWIDYRPALVVGNQSHVADDSVAFPSGGGSDPFGSAPSGTAEGPVEGEATAEWLEVRVTPPGAEPEIARRTVFDRLPADLRAAGELSPGAIEPLELVDFDGTGSVDFLPMLGIRTFVIATGPTTAASVAASGDELGMFALAFHSVRDAMAAEMALDAGARTSVDGPNIVSLAIQVDGNAHSHTTRVGLDIWQRKHGILPLTAPSIGVAQSELVAGVMSHIAERFAVETLASSPDAPLSMIGVGQVFEEAAREGIPTLVLHGTVPDAMPYGAAATGLIRDAVSSGDVVVVPATPVMVGGRERVGWWRIDPKTGVTTDMMDDRSGATMADYTVIVESEVGQLICIGAMAEAAAEVIIASATMLGSFWASALYRLYLGGVGGTSCV